VGTRALLERFATWRAAGRPLVLATVVATSGSTYSKPGHRILIAASDEWQGLVSGGCLEGDLALHAERVRADGVARVIDYDLRMEAGDVFGLGVGCDGFIRVLLQRLDPDRGFEPFATLARHIAEGPPAPYLVVTAAHGELAPGATLVGAPDGGTALAHDLTPAATRRLLPLLTAAGARPAPATLPGAATPGALTGRLELLPRLLVLGAGPDVPPLVTMARLLDFHVTVYDHRPGSTARPDLAGADRIVTATPADLPREVALARVAAAVVMSHHLESDGQYLAALARSPVPAIALLGPRARRERLLAGLGADAAALAGRLRSPAGLDLGHDTPAGIALAIVAELCARLHGRSGQPLGERAP
jgi:xanthine dehydrogenase accessory factor